MIICDVDESPQVGGIVRNGPGTEHTPGSGSPKLDRVQQEGARYLRYVARQTILIQG